MKVIDRFNAEKGMAMNRKTFEISGKNYFSWNLEIFPMGFGKRILDIGCGPGNYLDAILAFNPSLYVGLDDSAAFLNQVETLLAGRKNFRTCPFNILAKDFPLDLLCETFDIFLCFDVLEHLQNDVSALSNIRELMASSGAKMLFIRVPGIPLLYGKNDRAIGHHRRYTRKTLATSLQKAGFHVQSIYYQNLAGVLPWLVIGRFIRRKLAISPVEGKIFDCLVPLLRRIEQFVPIPFGLSIYCVATPGI